MLNKHWKITSGKTELFGNSMKQTGQLYNSSSGNINRIAEWEVRLFSILLLTVKHSDNTRCCQGHLLSVNLIVLKLTMYLNIYRWDTSISVQSDVSNKSK